jgi:hypothetical protein
MNIAIYVWNIDLLKNNIITVAIISSITNVVNDTIGVKHTLPPL